MSLSVPPSGKLPLFTHITRLVPVPPSLSSPDLSSSHQGVHAPRSLLPRSAVWQHEQAHRVLSVAAGGVADSVDDFVSSLELLPKLLLEQWESSWSTGGELQRAAPRLLSGSPVSVLSLPLEQTELMT